MLSIIGIDHKTAPIDIREAFSFVPADAVDFLRRAKSLKIINGGVLISTCNRTEIYVDSDLEQKELEHHLIRYVMEYKKMPNTHRRYFYFMSESDAIRHLFALVAGYRSLVQGETQIVGQVKEALFLARSASVTTNIILRLFDKALEVSKVIRTTHPVKAVNTSAGAAAVEFMRLKYGDGLKMGRTLILGAGQMAVTVIQSLKGLGVKDLAIYNRTADRALKCAEANGISQIYHGDTLSTALRGVRWLWVATSASTPIIDKTSLGEGVVPIDIFDMALPRNAAEDVAEVSGVSLYCIDDLGSLYSEANTVIPDSVREVLDTAVMEYLQWRDGLTIRDVYSLIRSDIDDILAQELANLPVDIGEEISEAVNKHCSHLSHVYSTTMISRLRKLTEDTKDPIYAEVVRKLLTM
ncbi:glutamyl-tRNA reductase [Porphyromonas sp.]|uniref:glutamyl-tRNA reductase n=1 Tax=Porphyromonas sp. TaxID=1924944 RepID=UPI0026DDB564|nr:glutamyl-tRNA reductase [Porphyromonas sp.]MDO4695327.1 glutamyl-tRNA reductase [Porphyromonas sp.]MDO4771087.1 glutamyl-tRNA reductase [Porphyromonas sp.]